jgi:hypothetical protein
MPETMAVSRHLGSEVVRVLDKGRKEIPAFLFGVMCVALGMTISLLSFSFQISSPSLASTTEPSTITIAPPSDEYALAYRESFGLFDDIPEKSWKRMQHHARNYVQYYKASDPILHISKPVQWFIENQEVCTCVFSALVDFVNGKSIGHSSSRTTRSQLFSPPRVLYFYYVSVLHTSSPTLAAPTSAAWEETMGTAMDPSGFAILIV